MEKRKIGFMQGRLSPMVDGKIQAFPWDFWQEEFALAQRHNFDVMEWTLDQERLYENPVMIEKGRGEIKALMAAQDITIPSLTGDCFMQAPFYKRQGAERESLLNDLANIIKASAEVGIRTILIPLVDLGRLENQEQKNSLMEGLSGMNALLEKTGVRISFESDFSPEEFARFMESMDSRYFGITYDIGNSAALGYNPEEEIGCYGNRIINVHVKDRLRGGTTVPLGEGDADIPGVLRALQEAGYKGNYILQTARAIDDNHVDVLCRYRSMVESCFMTIEK